MGEVLTPKEGVLSAQLCFGERARALREKLRAEHGDAFDSVAVMDDVRDENEDEEDRGSTAAY